MCRSCDHADYADDTPFTDAELSNPGMPEIERLSRMIARGLGHNDDGGMDWERYTQAAWLIMNHCRIEFSPIPKKST